MLTAAKSKIPGETPDDSPLATKLEQELATCSGVARWLHWLEAVEKAGPADYPRLARLAQGNPAAIRFLTARWIELYPQNLFDVLAEAFRSGGSRESWRMLNELANTLFRDWPKRDPEAAIEAVNGLQDAGLRDRWRVDVAEGVIETNPERGLRLMSDWHIERFGPRMDAVTKWAAADPRHAAEFALGNWSGYVSELTMEAIGKEWAKADPAGALEFAAAKAIPSTEPLASAALKQWAAQNVNDAASWLAQADDRTRNTLSPAFVEAWAKQDAPAALGWCDANLSGSSLIQAVGGVLKGAADKDVASAAALVSSLSPSSARAEAAVAVAKKWFPELSGDEPIKPAAIAWLSGLDNYSIERVVDGIQWGWATTDPNSMAAFLASSAGADIADSAYTILGRELARKNPTKALEWANDLPGDRGLSAGSAAFATWRTSQPEAASEWLTALPPSDPRRTPFFESAVREVAWGDPQAAQQFAAMPAADRVLALNVVQKMSLPEERRASLLDVLKAR